MFRGLTKSKRRSQKYADCTQKVAEIKHGTNQKPQHYPDTGECEAQ